MVDPLKDAAEDLVEAVGEDLEAVTEEAEADSEVAVVDKSLIYRRWPETLYSVYFVLIVPFPFFNADSIKSIHVNLTFYMLSFFRLKIELTS